MSTLKEFISNVRDGMAKSAHFAVMVNLPSAMAIENLFKNKIAKVMLFCEQAALPGISLGTSPVRSFGEFKEVPYEKLYEPITLNFYVDKDMIVKYMFDIWMDRIQDTQTRIHTWPKKYKSRIDIFTYDTNNNRKYRVRLNEAYPKAVSAIQLDYNSKDVMRIQVQFSYKYLTTSLVDLGVEFDGIPNAYLSDFELFNMSIDI
jgi:hypothetical protein